MTTLAENAARKLKGGLCALRSNLSAREAKSQREKLSDAGKQIGQSRPILQRKLHSRSNLQEGDLFNTDLQRRNASGEPLKKPGGLSAITKMVIMLVCLCGSVTAAEELRTYRNTLTRLVDPPPLLADHPEFVEPIKELIRYEAPLLVDDEGADLHVRAWRFSYNARGIIEMPNRLRAEHTALIVVHPWGIDDGQGWQTPEPAGVCDFCTPSKNALAGRHTREVIHPLIKSLRGKVRCVVYSLTGDEDPIRKKLYRSIDSQPSEADRAAGANELKEKLASFKYRGEPLPQEIKLSKGKPVVDYFKQFPGLDAGAKFNGAGFWELPVPVTSDIKVDPNDIVIYDQQGYEKLRKFLEQSGIRHVLLAGYATDMCFCRTTAGYENLSKDFNVFLIGDATLATFPSNSSPKCATNAAISFAALNQLITQVSWIRLSEKGK